MLLFSIITPIIVGLSILLFVIIKCVKNVKVSIERRAYFEGKKIIDKYCCDIKMRLVSLDCHYSGGGTKEYYICYVCQKQIEYEKPEDWHTGEKYSDSIWQQVETGQHKMNETYRWGGFSGNRKK